MNYWERHIGDYARDTAHLTMIEHGAYSLLLDRYYATERPIPADQVHRLSRARTRDEKAAVDAVLAEFFVLIDGEWLHNRADREIEKLAAKCLGRVWRPASEVFLLDSTGTTSGTLLWIGNKPEGKR